MTGKIHICYQLSDPVTGDRVEAVRGIDQALLEIRPDKTTCLYELYEHLKHKCEKELEARRTAGPKGKLP